MKKRLLKLTLGTSILLGLMFVSPHFVKAAIVVQSTFSADELDATYTTGQAIELGTGLSGGFGQVNIPFKLGSSITNVYKMVQLVKCDEVTYSIGCVNAITDTVTDSDGTWPIYREGPVGGFQSGVNNFQLQPFNLPHKVIFNPTKYYLLTYKIGTAWLHNTNIKGLGSITTNQYPDGLYWNANNAYLPAITIADTGVSGFVNFISPISQPYSATVNGGTVIADNAISDFTSWQIQVANVPSTSTDLTLTVSTALGTDSMTLPANTTSTSTYQILTIPKSYPLPAGSTTTPLNYNAVVSLNYKNSGDVIDQATTYFNLALGAPPLVTWSNGSHQTIGGQGCGVLCNDKDLIQRNLNQQFANDQVRKGLGDLFPFAYFYQISDIINALQNSATTSSSTALTIDTYFSSNHATTTPIEVFGDNELGNGPFKGILAFLKTILTMVLYVSTLFYFYSRIKGIFNYNKEGAD